MSIFKSIYNFFSMLLLNRMLIVEMAKREINDRFKGQIFGRIWIFVHPLILMSIYIFIFVFVFKTKVGGTREMPLDFVTYLLSGLIPWLVFQESMAKSTNVILANANLVKQVVFPIEILPVKTVLTTLIPFGVFLTVLVTYVTVYKQAATMMMLLLPVLVYMQVIAMIGVAFFLSSVGVYFKDIKDFIQMLSIVGVFLMPIFYLPSQVPDIAQPIIMFNPFSHLVYCYQDVFYFGRFEHIWSWVIIFVLSHFILGASYAIFKKLKVMFGNVL